MHDAYLLRVVMVRLVGLLLFALDLPLPLLNFLYWAIGMDGLDLIRGFLIL